MKKFNLLLEIFICVTAVAFVAWLKHKPGDAFWEPFFISLAITVAVALCANGVKWLTHHLPRIEQLKAMMKPFKNWALLIISGGLLALEIIGLIAHFDKGGDAKELAILIMGLLLFGSSFIYFMLIHMFGAKKAPQYDTDQHYLYLLFGMSRTEIEWKHITHFSLAPWEKMYDKEVVVVHIDNNEEVLANGKNFLVRKGIEFNIDKFGSPYYLPVEGCILSPQEVCNALEKELQKHKPAKTIGC